MNNSNSQKGSTEINRSGMNVNSATSDEKALLESIRQLGFVKTEIELYLDTHPDCKVAIDYYHRTVDALASLMDRYHSVSTNPIIAAGSNNAERWDWVNEPWPWFRSDATEQKRSGKE